MTIENIFDDLLINFSPITQTRSTTNASASEVVQSKLLSASQTSQNTLASSTTIQAQVQTQAQASRQNAVNAAQEKDEIFTKLPPSILEIILTHEPNTIKDIVKHMRLSGVISLHEKNIANAILNEKNAIHHEINKKIEELESRHRAISSKMDASICNAFSKEGGCEKSEEEYIALEMQAYSLEDEIALLRDLKTSLKELERLKLRYY